MERPDFSRVRASSEGSFSAASPQLSRVRLTSANSASRSPNSNNASKLTAKYRSYTNDYKIKVISECSDASTRSVAAKYELNESTIRAWIKNKEKFKEGATTATGKLKKRLPVGGRKPLAADMEAKLIVWIELK